MGRNTDSAHSTTQQTSLFVEKVHQTGRAVSNLITTKDRFFRPCVLNVQSTMLIKMLNFQYDLVVCHCLFVRSVGLALKAEENKKLVRDRNQMRAERFHI